MLIFVSGPHEGTRDNLHPVEGWGDVPETDRPLWSRYMVDHCPWFPGVGLMNFVAAGVVNGGTRAPKIWKDAAIALHRAGFTPMHYYVLAQLLRDERTRGRLNEDAHGHLFEEWFQAPFNSFRLYAPAWKPWVEGLKGAE